MNRLAAVAALVLLAGCADPAALTPSERTEREVALTQRQLELLQLDEAAVIALYGAPDRRDADPGGLPVLGWDFSDQDYSCALEVTLDAERRAAAVDFGDSETDGGLRACARWL